MIFPSLVLIFWVENEKLGCVTDFTLSVKWSSHTTIKQPVSEKNYQAWQY